jgi:RNA polymerase sigma factor (sigma-70 family)
MDPSDEALVLACRRGDVAAWEALIARYQRLIYTIARRAGLDADQSADVFQRVFAALVENLDDIEQPALIGAWLVTTARREAWRLSKQERTWKTHPDDDRNHAPVLLDRAALPDEVVLRLEEQHNVRTAVVALDERCRHLLTLLFYRSDPPPYAEIAATLGMREGSIGPIRARCLQKLRRHLDSMGF